jgi:hypothetical protein
VRSTHQARAHATTHARTGRRARDCQRSNKALCFAADHPFYDATHNGLDAMVVRWGGGLLRTQSLVQQLVQGVGLHWGGALPA